MPNILNTVLSDDELAQLERDIGEHAEAGRAKQIEKAIKKLRRYQSRQRSAALSLVRVIGRGALSIEGALDVLREIYSTHAADPEVLAKLGNALDAARDIDMLNAAAPEDPLFSDVCRSLAGMSADARGMQTEAPLLKGLATAARMSGRGGDEIAETAHRRLVELEPDDEFVHYNFGLFLKTRGRFHEGMLANQQAVRLAPDPSEASNWNLGICATGAREGLIALEVWKRLGSKIEMGRFDLPEGRYASVKVRLAERPLAERTKEHDDPGLEETIWVERLSPCHGIIRSVLYQPLGVDYGDVILFDGAPITYHKYGERDVPVFPHLATLVRQHYQFFDFAGTQDEQGQLADATTDLEADAVVYSHSENFQVLCASCWRDASTDHKEHKHEQLNVVTGRIAAPPELSAQQLLAQLDAALAKRTQCKLYVPDLCKAAGMHERSAIERRRYELIAANC